MGHNGIVEILVCRRVRLPRDGLICKNGENFCFSWINLNAKILSGRPNIAYHYLTVQSDALLSCRIVT